MANFPCIYKNAIGKFENLLPADGGIEIDVIDCAAANSTVTLFDTVDNTGTLTLFAAFDAVAGVGLVGSTFAFAGSITVATDTTVTGVTTLNGAVALGDAAGDDITITGSVASDITFKTGADRTITVDSQHLTISTTTAGILTLDAVTEIQMDTILVDVNATGAITLDAVAASQFVVSGAANDLTLGGRNNSIALNDAGNLVLDTNFTATTILGAINEVKTTNLGVTTAGYLASEAIVIGDVVYLDWDAGNVRTGVYLADNTVAAKQNPVGVALTGGGVGTTIYIAAHGQEAIINSLIAANNEGNPAYLDTAGSLTIVPPVTATHTSQIVGTVSTAGAAGVAKIIVQLYEAILL